eukprot:m.242615 g.242615  ORF g.242615 m.242615 type:complete len:706 (+) comp26340_c0_seq1:1750-3867(+)
MRACTRAHSFERLKTMERGASIMRLLGVVVVVAAACGAVASGEKPRPNLILLLVDDLGHNDVGWANNRTITPNLDRMVKEGVELTSFYVFKYCAPTRGALMSGRYPFHFGFYNNQDANDYGIPTNFTLLPALLKSKGGYKTHMIGKWHLGFRSKELTPTYRGFDTYLGYYHMEEDYYSHQQAIKGGDTCSGSFTDFSNSSADTISTLWGHGGTPGPGTPSPPPPSLSCGAGAIVRNQCAHAFQGELRNLTTDSAEACCSACQVSAKCKSFNWNHPVHPQSVGVCYLKSIAAVPNPGSMKCDYGTVPAPTGQSEVDYSALIFAKEAQRIITKHAATETAPLFMYLPFQSVHGPYEAPERFVALYNDTNSPHYIADLSRRTHQGMVTALDEAVGNVSATLVATGLADNTIVWMSSDNGGPLPTANNFPLRGGKFTLWEGGTKVRSFIWAAPTLLPGRPGTVYDGLLHATDVYRTFLAWASIDLPDASGPTGGDTGPIAFDGFDQSIAISSGLANASQRRQILHAPLVPVLNPAVCSGGWGQSCGAALRSGDYKIIVGYPGDARALPLPASENAATQITANDNRIKGVTPAVRAAIGGDGGGPGPDGCSYNNGTGCPCFHKPCLFNVATDPSESHDLGGDPQYTTTLRTLLLELQTASSTVMPPAGLVGAMYDTDTKLQCTFVAQAKCFQPYGSFIPWLNRSMNVSIV